jgi:hypothetical protein
LDEQPTTRRFAERWRLRVQRQSDNELVVVGRFGHIYKHGPEPNIFGLVLEAPADSTRMDKTLLSRKRRALQAGFRVHLEGDVEAILLFDAGDPAQAKLAIKLVGARQKRQVKQSAAFLEVRKRFQFQRPTVVQGHETEQTATISPEVETEVNV